MTVQLSAAALLAVHGWAHRQDVDGTAKITWLREQRGLFDNQVRHEAFRLIEVALLSANPETADALVADILAGPDDNTTDEEGRAYERFNALAWITRHAPALGSARAALEQVKAENPEFEEREHPDLLSWMQVGTAEPQPPMSAVDLHERIAADAASAIADLRRYENATFPFETPSWSGALAVLAEAVRNHPSDGFAVIEAPGGDQRDIVRSVISGWSSAPIDTETAESILQRLASLDLAAVADDLSGLLVALGRTDAIPTEWHRFPAARALAADLWASLPTEPPPDDVDDWLKRLRL